MLTTAELAKIVGVTPRRLLAIAARRGVRPARQVGHAHLWRPAQAEQLRPGRVGIHRSPKK